MSKTILTYSLVYPETMRDQYFVHVHAVGCADLKRPSNQRSVQTTEDLNLDDAEQFMPLLDPDELGYEPQDVRIFNCATEAHQAAQKAAKPRARRSRVTTPTPTPQPTSVGTKAPHSTKLPRARKVREEARAANEKIATPTPAPRAARARRNGKVQEQAARQAREIIAEAVTQVLSGDAEWSEQRSPKCSDEDYALAVKVRTLRGQGEAWWRIAHTLGLPGSGPSVAQGKTGAANARRAWERAWGTTYKATNVPRETKEIKRERAMTHESRPYFSESSSDEEVLDMIASWRKITWFTRLGAGNGVVVSEQTAIVLPHTLKIVQGPKGRVVEFFEEIVDEQYRRHPGPRRSVYVSHIEKLGS
jgi:hypothetical protein